MDTPAPTLVEAVKSSPLGAGLDDAQVAVLAGLVEMHSFEPHQVLAPEGRADERLVVLLEGRLASIKHLGEPDEAQLVTLVAGDFAHELSFLDGSERYASLVAMTPARVLMLERRQLESLIDTQPRVLYAVMRAIVRVVHRVQTRLAVQASELTNYIVKQHGRY